MAAKQAGNKREKEKDKKKKRKEKEQRKEERRKHSTKGLGLDALVVAAAMPAALTEPVAEHVPAGGRDQAPEVKVGKVVFLDLPKCYGFIRDARVKENLFFSTGDLAWEIRLNDLVTFTRIKSSRGSTATAIEKITDTITP